MSTQMRWQGLDVLGDWRVTDSFGSVETLQLIEVVAMSFTMFENKKPCRPQHQQRQQDLNALELEV